MASLLNRLYWFGVVGCCTLGLNWGVCLHCVCLYFSIGSTGLVWYDSVHLGSISRGRGSSFLNRFYWFGVVGLCTHVVD